MASGEAPLSRPSASRQRLGPPGDDADEASSPKRQKRSHHRDHHRHHHRHGYGDRGDREEASRRSSAMPGEGEAEDGEILDDAAVARGPDADFGKAGLVFGGLASAPHKLAQVHRFHLIMTINWAKHTDMELQEYDDKSYANLLHASGLASDRSEKYDVLANKQKSDHAAHEPENGTICSSDRKYSKHNEPVERMSRSPQSRSDREIEHKDAEVNDTEARSKLGHLVSKKEINGMQNGRDERHARSNVSQTEDHSMRYPYSRKYRSSHAYRETSSKAHGLRNVVRDASEHENGGRCVELDRYSTRRWVTRRGSYKERERSSVDRDRQSSSTRYKNDDGRRKDKINDSFKVPNTVGNILGMQKLSGDREMRHFRANKMDTRQTGELNGEYEHNDSTHAKYGLASDSKDLPISGEKCKEANHRRKRSEEIKDESCKEEDQDNFEQLAKQEDDPEKIKEEARNRRDAILEKHRQRQLQKQQQGPVPCLDNKEITSLDRDAAATEVKDVNLVTLMVEGKIGSNHEPSNMAVNGKSYTVGKSPSTQPNISINLGLSGDQRTTGVSGSEEGIPMSEKSSDIHCGDIFGASPIRVRQLGNQDGMNIWKNALRDNWDDEHGYYKYHLGEVLDGRYRITAGYGKGVFSTVVQAKDLKAGKNDPEEVAIKIICNDDTKERYKSGKMEVSVLKKLSSTDREDKRHCVRFISSFIYRDHPCLVFESLRMNLREVIKKFGRDIGLKLTAVRTYSKQLFIALKHLKDCSILHCDIKPDNILVNGSKNLLKLCDFGSALSAGVNDITPILVSSFYRAPEIILGLPYDHSLDMWSVGCCLYELYTGKILFPGGTNNGMLWLHMELKGPFPKKMLQKGAFTSQHFDQDLNFHVTDENLMMKKAVNKLHMNIKSKGVGSKISSFPGEDPKMLSKFKDLLEKIFVLDPEKRLAVSQALGHPFITGK